jgi:protoheme IX farnesyltransferase
MPTDVSRAVPAARPALGAWAELTKPGLTGLVLATTVAGYALGAAGSFDGRTFVLALLGTALLASAASALNQWWEVRWDRQMERTRNRPLPSRRLPAWAALAFGSVASLLGVAVLARSVNGLTAVLGAGTLLIYLLVYTPLKRRTTLCTIVGAVSGAIPPVMGYTAAAGTLGAGAWVLFGILFVWQVPHFLAIAWLYREDYARGGFRMLPVVDPEGRLTGRMVVLYCVALVPVSLSATLVGMSGFLYPFGAAILGTGMLGLGLNLRRERTRLAARRLFLATITYLPLLLALLALDPTAPGRFPS